MDDHILICTDLDRTLIPNGPQPESPQARDRFRTLVARPEVTLAYVSGRHRALIQQAITNYRLPFPDFVIGDVGTTLYQVSTDGTQWTPESTWQTVISQDWAGHSRADIKVLLTDLSALRQQEPAKQNDFKLSYYVPLQSDLQALSEGIDKRLTGRGIAARQIWSVDEPAGVGLLDILPARASKLHAIDALMHAQHFTREDTVFCGDSGNDIEVLASHVKAVLVGNAQAQVRAEASRLAAAEGHSERLYIAQGGYLGMNGNYSAGMLEGIAHYFSFVTDWLLAAEKENQA